MIPGRADYWRKIAIGRVVSVIAWFRQLLLLSWPVSHNTISLKDRTGTGESDRLLERTNTRMIHAAPLRPNKRRKGKLPYAGEQIANMLQSARFVWAVS